MPTLRNKRGFFIVAVLALAALALWNARYRVPRAPSVSGTSENHKQAPDFALTRLDGTRLNLSDYRGKVVLLDFWATWCAPCREEIPRFVEWQNRYGPQGLQVVGISMDDGPKPVIEFNQEFKINYPVAIGNPEVANSYGGVLGLPLNIVIGRNGEITAKHLGMADLNALEQEIKAELTKR